MPSSLCQERHFTNIQGFRDYAQGRNYQDLHFLVTACTFKVVFLVLLRKNVGIIHSFPFGFVFEFFPPVVTLFSYCWRCPPVQHTVLPAYGQVAIVQVTAEEISAVTCRIMSHRADLEADWAKVLLMDSQEQSPMTLSLDQLNCQVATKNIHWGFQPVPFWLRASGHLYLEPNQGVWLLVWTNSRKCSRKKPLWDVLLQVYFLGIFFS